MAQRDFYDILEIEPEAHADKIRQKYRDLVYYHHPDQHADDPKRRAIAEEKLKELNVAYDTLKDPQKRAAYDAKRTGQTQSSQQRASSQSSSSASSRGYRPGTPVSLRICTSLTPPTSFVSTVESSVAELYCIAESVADFLSTMTLTFVWKFKGHEAHRSIERPSHSTRRVANVKHNQGELPVGKWQVELWVDGTLAGSADFRIFASAPQVRQTATPGQTRTNPKDRDFYDILDIEPEAPADKIRQKYRDLVYFYHPDQHTDPKKRAIAEENLKELNVAYDTLKDPHKRAAYDARRTGQTQSSQQRASSQSSSSASPQGYRPGTPDVGQTRTNPKDNAEMIWIPAGTLEGKTLVQGFWMYKYEVTNASYRKFVEANLEWKFGGSKAKQLAGSDYLKQLSVSDYLKHWRGKDMGYASTEDNAPVVWVSWHAAEAYSQWAGCDLPTHDQWEWAARGGLRGMKFVWGDQWPPPKGAGNFADQTAKRKFGWTAIDGYDDGYAGTSPVGRFSPNGYGLYDMAGNVWEWVAESENESRRYLRGGSFYYDPRPGRIAVSCRCYDDPRSCLFYCGFRCARTP